MSKSVYEIVTEKIVAAIEAGVSPWRQPWRAVGGAKVTLGGVPVNGPVNAVTGKRYRGVNVLLLGATMQAAGYNDPRFLTYNQAKSAGGNVKKGEKGSIVVFWKRLEVKAGTPTTDEEGNEQPAGKTRYTFLLRYYTVFNVEQCENLKLKAELEEVKPEPKSAEVELTPVEEAEAILAGIKSKVTGGVFHTSAGRACYSPSSDRIEMPHVEQFESMEAYYATRFHEEAHATGAAKRLNRPGIVNFDGFGSDQYSREELVAEMASAFLCNVAGIDSTLDRSAAYLVGWLKPLKSDPKMIVVAAAQASKAADYILGIGGEEASDEE